MQKTSGVLVVMALICLSIPSATAQEAHVTSFSSTPETARGTVLQTPKARPLEPSRERFR